MLPVTIGSQAPAALHRSFPPPFVFDRTSASSLISYSNNVFSHPENIGPPFKDEKRLPWLQEKIPPISSAG